MAGRVAGKVAFVTGAGHGQGRSHAIRLAEEGAGILAVDILHDYDTVGYGMSTEADLAETVKAVEALDRRIVATQADVRDAAGLKKAVDDGVAQLGKLRSVPGERRLLVPDRRLRAANNSVREAGSRAQIIYFRA